MNWFPTLCIATRPTEQVKMFIISSTFFCGITDWALNIRDLAILGQLIFLKCTKIAVE